MDEHTHDTPETPEESGAVRPDEVEPNGPLEGLVTSAVDELQDHLTDNPAAEAHEVDPGIGVEEEGIEASQLFGMMFATMLSIASLVFVLYFLFFVTQRDEARNVSEDVPADRYVEQRELRAEAEDAYAHYSVSPDGEGRYRIPIDAAMQIVERNATGGEAAPASRVDFNLAWLNLHPAPAVAGSVSGEPSELATPVVSLDSTTVVEQPEIEPEPVDEPAEPAEEGH